MDAPQRSPSPPGGADVARLLERHLPGLQAFVRARCGPVVRARESLTDLVQSVCAELLEERSRFAFHDDDAFRGWLHLAAERKIVDRVRYWRAERRDFAREVRGDMAGAEQLAAAFADFVTPSQACVSREELARIERAFDDLPPAYRDVIAASRLLGLSHGEIARRIGRDVGAVRTLLCRALARFATLLGRAD